MDLLSLAFSLFVVMDALGNLPICMHFLKHFSAKKQKRILIREMFIALGFLAFFYFIGPTFLNALKLDFYTVQISGGIILFLMAIKMIFPVGNEIRQAGLEQLKEPLIVPIAIPLIAGPGLFAMVILYSKQVEALTLLSALIIAWAVSLLILLSGNFLSRILKKKGLFALERLMGLILILIASQMFLNGISTYLKNNGH